MTAAPTKRSKPRWSSPAATRVRVVKFRRNYRQTAAMAAGLEHALGDVLVTMGGDLQNDTAGQTATVRHSVVGDHTRATRPRAKVM